MSASKELIRHQADEIRWLRVRVRELEEKLLYMIDKPYEVPPIDFAPQVAPQEPQFYDPMLEVLD